MSLYGVLAGRYDNEIRDEFSRVCARISDEHLRANGVDPPSPLLELACGTGLTAHLLQGSGYQVTGVDSSEDMLALARQRTGHAASPPVFLSADIRSLPELGPFLAATCFGDVLNHLTSPEDAQAMLACVFSRLSPGGWLICDTSTLETFRSRMWNAEQSPTIWNRMRVRTSCRFDEEEGLARMECHTYKMGQDTEVHTLVERYYSESTVRGWLEQLGFTEIESRRFHPLNLRRTFPEVKTMKTLWLARKPR